MAKYLEPRNGILLMKHLHEFFDARLFVHSDTLRIRVFVPYDALTELTAKELQYTQPSIERPYAITTTCHASKI
jgi:hypothetical protein